MAQETSKIYKSSGASGGDTMTVANGGTVYVESGGAVHLKDSGTLKLGTGTDGTFSYNATRQAAELKMKGDYYSQLGLSDRIDLKWIAGLRGKPGLQADHDADLATALLTDPDFEILGTNAASNLVTHDAEGGIILTTAGADNDQMILAPNLAATYISPWNNITWGSDRETRWEAVIETQAAITNTIIWAGLKLTNTPTTATDADQCFFRYQNGVNSGGWQAISSIGGTDDAADSGVVVAATTMYHLVIDIQSGRTALMYINGALVETSGALTDAKDFIPYIGVQASGEAAAKALGIHGQAASRLRGAA